VWWITQGGKKFKPLLSSNLQFLPLELLQNTWGKLVKRREKVQFTQKMMKTAGDPDFLFVGCDIVNNF
jgi:hypothetical protein